MVPLVIGRANGTIGTIGRANGTIDITIGTNGITNGTISRTLNDIGIPLVTLVACQEILTTIRIYGFSKLSVYAGKVCVIDYMSQPLQHWL